ncbi:hypothetical protein MGG_10674 [Pyricularia oryzae 70-15]|uniref:DNA-directed RNA polymerase subunit n=3 Tax=Pyricularia oryzae TaxID=318829 RepID=G4N9S9_PYRO7|nr:uncharacterized protein MGG_10674 [Pyricularia oryzae 70-15]EHA49586.1 hypothetical protein MGG_10674 [Pyricularia oryzae 70-15]ELQ40248.1 hypothetical protein OOU_Y34scaffold00456g20 [Pyricularia oryzae Y34]KAI7917723.1 hypothetical protein M9X92_007287 [Pyricularia oryzae]KAI7918520.1 hypothetical protein M0657_007541 [Pyricularia oryzae]
MPAIIETDLPSSKADKKSKKNKEKKRPREDDEATEARNNKRSKSEAPTADEAEDGQHVNGGEKKKHKKSRKSKQTETEDVEVEPEQVEEARAKKEKKQKKKKDKTTNGEDASEEVVPESPVKSTKKSKKVKSEVEAAPETIVDNAATEEAAPEKKKKKRSRRKSDRAAEEDVEEEYGAAKTKKSDSEALPPDSPASQGFALDLMDVDSPSVARSAKPDILQPAHAPSNPEFPFATQIVSLYVPLFPIGFDQPLTKVAEQHLKPLLNHYSPLMKGVLLDYRHVTLGELPTRADPRNPPTDRTPTLLSCKDEYAVGFGWLTAEVYLFVPRRGAWMEGVVNLQSEGHLGVVCWNRFNASIEANRVPEGWKFIDVVQKAEDAKKAKFRNAGKKINLEEAEGEGDEEAEAAEEAGEDDQEELEASLQQMHATGYWVDAAGKRIAGKIRFRIKNFDVGTAGDHGYISIEGTMLDDEAERELRVKEKEREKARMAKASTSGMLRRLTRSVPEFSMTSFGKEDEEEDSSKKVELYSGSRPMTPS